jgi:hypothetical protein
MDTDGLLDAVDRGDARMVERGKHLRLALEAGDAFGIRSECFWKDLQCNVALKPHVTRPTDLAHAAGPNGGLNLVHADAGSWCERHRSTSSTCLWVGSIVRA